MDKQSSAVNQDKTGNRNLQSNMFRAGGFSASQANQNPHSAMRAGQLSLDAGMYNGDRFSQQFHGALQGSQYGHNPSSLGHFNGRGDGGSSTSDQQSLLQSYGQSNYPSSNAPSGAGYNPAFDDMAQLLGMPGSSHPPS